MHFIGRSEVSVVISWAIRMAKRTPLGGVVHWWRRARDRRLPTQAAKYATIREYAAAYEVHTFVETGTYEGDAVFACLGSFDRIYSIELATELFQRASDRFAGDSHVEILQGDSTYVLPAILEKISEPCLFWLDGHYSCGTTAQGEQDTPIRAELRAILDHRVKGHVVLIDDARLFAGRNGYPTLSDVKEVVLCTNPLACYSVKDDIVRLLL